VSARSLVVLHWDHGEGLVVARPAFWGDQPPEAARRSVASAVAAIKEEVVERDVIPSEVESPVLRRFDVDVRPQISTGPKKAGKGKKRGLGAVAAVRVPVDVVWGRVSEGLCLCEIIQFNHVFVMSDPEALPALVEHFVRETAAHEPVDALFTRAYGPTVAFSVTTLRPKDPDAGRRADPPERLTRVAERVTGPPPGAPGPWERDDTLTELGWRLENGQGFVLMGEPRSGRSAVLLEAIRRKRKGVQVYRTQARRLVAGARYLGEWQGMCEAMVKELVELEAFLWVEDLVELFRVGGHSAADSVGAWLRAAMPEGLRLIGEINPREAEVLRRLSPGFLESVRIVEVDALTDEELGRVTTRLAEHLERAHGLRVEPAAARLARRVLARFVREEAFPGKLVRFLEDTARDAARRGLAAVDDAAVLDAFGRRTGMPAVLLDDRVALPIDSLSERLSRRIVGQPAAVDALTRALVTFKAGLNDADRPIATMLFAGPTGVGKTATARALAEWAYGSDSALVRVDMSECQHPGQVARLIGVPGGAPGELVRRVRERPFSVVLFDEIEKAHPMFFDLLLGLLDEGTLSDGDGRVTSFRGSVVLLTTNLGTRKGSSLGFGGAGAGLDTTAIRNFFRPELLNRLDRIVAFSPLDPAGVRRIAERELELVATRPGFAGRGLQLTCSDAVVDRVVAVGFDAALGARPLQRAVEQLVVAALARYLLANPHAQDTVLAVDVVAGEIVVG
jgi:ATP-dependent Clp protease ATP-binding subunit ClpA